MNPRVVLIGAGGHAKVVNDALLAIGWPVVAYVDPNKAVWLNARQIEGDDAGLSDPSGDPIVIGLGGVNPGALEFRYGIMKKYIERGRAAPAVGDPRAIVSASAQISQGSQVLVGSVVNACAHLGEATIVNTRAVVEHDVTVGDGTHVAPGAIILGGATVGKFCLVGAGAIVLPGARVPDRTTIAAGSIYSV